MKNTVSNEDCLTAMQRIPDHSIDLVLCDLPYGTTRNHWDSVIPFDKMWTHYRRIVKPRGAVVLFAQFPFDKVLACSNLDWFRYEWIWQKSHATGFLNANHQPLKQHETVLVFSPSGAAYTQQTQNAMKYFPQFRTGKAYRSVRRIPSSNYDAANFTAESVTENDGEHYYPTSILQFKGVETKGSDRHPTQKPVDLLRYLIRTYTEKGDVVLDNCCGSGSTLVAAIAEGRDYIGIERDAHWFNVAQRRVAQALLQERDLFAQGEQSKY